MLCKGYWMPFKLYPTLDLGNSWVSIIWLRIFGGLDTSRTKWTKCGRKILWIVFNWVPAFYSRLFLIEEASGRWRLVINFLSTAASWLQNSRWGVALVLASIRKGDVMFSLILKDVCFQIPVHLELTTKLRVAYIYDSDEPRRRNRVS